MRLGVNQGVLRCERCNKPFDKQSTLKRHGYYCRSRRDGKHSPRGRSCQVCAKRKVRCDGHRPACSRCREKALACDYPLPGQKAGPSNTQHADDSSTKVPEMLLSAVTARSNVPGNQNAGDENRALESHAALALSQPTLASLGREVYDWTDPNIDFAFFLEPQMSDQDTSLLSLNSSPGSPRETRAHFDTASRLHELSIPMSPSLAVRSFIQRPTLKKAPNPVIKLIFHNLRSFPLMIIKHDSFPPFIHSHSMPLYGGDSDKESLNNSASLVHMMSSGIQGSRKLFWKNVSLECERFCADHTRLTKWELLAAMQALSIYILIRLDEGETDVNNFDSLLITAVITIARQLNQASAGSKTRSVLSGQEMQAQWKEWIFEESTRRLCVVYQAVNLLVHFEPAAMCDIEQETGLVIGPLPARRQLWEARDEFAWSVELGRECEVNFGLAANGQLVKLVKSHAECSDVILIPEDVKKRARAEGDASWEEWCAGMDGLGGLVMLAAALVGQ